MSSITFVFRGALFPINNGYRSTGWAQIRAVHAREGLHRAVLIGNDAIPSAEEQQTLEAIQSLGADTVFVPGTALGGQGRWQSPWESFRSVLSINWRQGIRALEKVFACQPGPIVFFTVGWDPALQLMKTNEPNTVVFVADSISLHEATRAAETMGLRRVIAASRTTYARRVERRFLRKPYRAFVYVSHKDLAYAASLGGDQVARKGYVVPIGLHVDDLPCVSTIDFQDIAREPVIAFSGVMSYAPNEMAGRELIDEVLPAIGIPAATLLLIGRDSERFQGLHPRVHASGWVSSIPEALSRAHIFVAPVRYGAGAKNNVLSALAMGLPVVGYQRIFESFEKLPIGAYPCSSQHELLETVRNLLSDPQSLAISRTTIANAIRNEWDWSESARQLMVGATHPLVKT